MKKFNWQNIRIILMIFFMVFLYSFTNNRSNQKKIKGVSIEFQGDNKMFLTTKIVNNLLIQKLKGTSTIQKEQVDLKDLENVLNKHPFVENAEVFTSQNGELIIQIKQKSPIARLVTNNRNFYIDKNGSVFQTSNNFAPRVPLIQGSIEGEFKKGFIKTLLEINKDEFLKKNIIAIDIQKNSAMKLYVREHNFEIQFGKPVFIEKKFKNYKAFYQYAIKDTLLKKYKAINLIFTQQVVCTK